MRKGFYFLVGAVVTAVIAPFFTKLGEQLGLYDDPRGMVASVWGELLSSALWVGSQWWYTHGLVALLFAVVGLVFGYNLQRPAAPEVAAEDAPIIPSVLMLQESIDRTLDALSEVLEWHAMGVANAEDYGRSSAEWRSTEILLSRFAMRCPAPKRLPFDTAEDRKAFLEKLYPLIRDGHVAEARSEADAYAGRQEASN